MRVLDAGCTRFIAAACLGPISFCLGFATASRAQEVRTPPSAAIAEPPIEDVLIVAQKRAEGERAQSVPIAISAFDAATLDELHAYTLQDLSAQSPNVTLDDAGTMPGYANFTIRGLGTNSTIPSVEPAVGVFVDGIYQGMSAGSVLNLFDVDDVEILRGPQATLFGRNTTGGAVLVNTRKPGDTFAVHGRASIESGLEETAGLSVEGPIGNRLRAKIAGYYDNDAGWFRNDFNGRSLGTKRAGFVRPMAVWAPIEAFETTLIYEHGWRNGGGAVAQNPAAFGGFHVNIDNSGTSKMDWEAVTLESDWRLGPGTITNLFGYRRLDQLASDDIDGRPVPGFNAFDVLRQHQFSEELRYAGKVTDQIDLTAGLYYFTQSFRYLERRVLAGGHIDSTMGGRIEDSNYAAFAQAEYHLVGELGLIAGGRFTSERKSARIATFVPVTAGSRCDFKTETCNDNFPGTAFPGSPGNDHWDNFVPKLGFEWQPKTALLVYGNWSQGVRSGGYNVRSTSFTVSPGPYGPELQDAFEVGIKSDWLDGRLRLDGAVFYDTIKNMQRDVNMTDPLVGVVQVTRNTANATIKGVEFEATTAVTDELALFGNAGYTEGQYDRVFFDLDGGGIGASDLGLSIPRLTKWSYEIGATYTREFGDGFKSQLRVDYGYRSRAASTDSNTAFLAPLSNLSAGASVTLPDRHWTLSVYGRNLLDRVSDGVVTPLPASLGGGAFRTLNEGRVIGAEAAFVY
jgi:iron complex outermembrane receptor protein